MRESLEYTLNSLYSLQLINECQSMFNEAGFENLAFRSFHFVQVLLNPDWKDLNKRLTINWIATNQDFSVSPVKVNWGRKLVVSFQKKNFTVMI